MAYFADSVLFISLQTSYNIDIQQGGGSSDSKGENPGTQASGEAEATA
jgi:hypothetical protein